MRISDWSSDVCSSDLMLEVRGGSTIAIATREAVAGDDLRRLESEVLVRFRRQLAEEQAARKDAQRLYLAAIRQICHFLRPGRSLARPATHIVSQLEGLEE